MGLSDLEELGAHDAPQHPLVAQDSLDVCGLFAEAAQLFADLLDLERSEPVELQLQDRVDLLVVEREPHLQPLGRAALAGAGSNDGDRLIEGVEDDLECFEDVDAPQELGEIELEPPAHHVPPEVEEVLQHLDQ